MTISRTMIGRCLLMTGVCCVLPAVPKAAAQTVDMSFFLTSVGVGKGGNLGGLAGADQHCQALAGAGAATNSTTWHAYLSTQAADGRPAVNARDRIGKGPWRNAKGVVIARDVADLHGASNNLGKQTALSEKGEVINGRGDTPNRHDVLTGSQATAPPLRRRRTAPAGTGRVRRRAPRCSATSIGWDCATMMRQGPGTRRIPRAGQMAAVHKPICRAPAVMGCYTASQ